ncbi:PREDICTED: microtubule-associated protein 10 [Galeopterus variegatus]|uniref:Microtubule-associated protein 10 n=1 Tax=Galeopterus variegatus TaxID=482537 RepID=A0ABM0REN7_GALVR|nr:PREDICTED: microtubule-associated protein 10 [Galeopterus variegatus]
MPLLSQPRRARFVLRGPVGRRVGDVELVYRLTELGAPERPPAPEPGPGDAERPPGASEPPEAQKELEEVLLPGEADSDSSGPVRNGEATSAATRSRASGGRSISPVDHDVTELDMETNTFCPPPLYYTHFTQGKTPPPPGKITIETQMHVPEELDDAFAEENLVKPPTHTSSLKHTNSATRESPPVPINSPPIQDMGAMKQTACCPQTEQSRINTISQLPLLNALLIELSLLSNQPMASTAHVHPHLAWLYRTEDKKAPESSAKSMCPSASEKDKLSMGEREKSVNVQCGKNQVDTFKKGKCFEKNSDAPQKRVSRGRPLYGLTKTLRLRLKQTNPAMLAIHEKREQHRKMQTQMSGTKFRIPSSQLKVLSFAEQSQKPHQLLEEKCLDSNVSFAENGDTSRQSGGVFAEASRTKENKLKRTVEKKTVDSGENRANNGTSEEVVSPVNSIMPERFTQTSILGGKVEMKVQTPSVSRQDATVDRIVADKEIGDRQVETTDDDILTAERRENSSSSCNESISELKFSDDFTSPCYSEDFCTTENTSRSLQAHKGSPRAENPKRSQRISQSSEAGLSIRKNSSGKSSIPSPPFSAGSPVLSCRRSHISKIQDKSLEEASVVSTSYSSSSLWTEEKENQVDQSSRHNSKAAKRDQDISVKLKTRTGCKSLEKSQSLRTSQESSYLPSNLSELKVLDSSISDHFEEDNDDFGSLNISKQCKDICELVVNKFPGYTM